MLQQGITLHYVNLGVPFNLEVRCAMIVDIVPLVNHWKGYQGIINFSTFSPEIITHRDGIATEEYFWLGRNLDRVDTNFEKVKIVEQHQGLMLEYLAVAYGEVTPQTILDPRREAVNIAPIGVRSFDQRGVQSHYYFTAALYNLLYDITNVYNTACTSVEATPQELDYLSYHPSFADLRRCVMENPNSLICNGAMIPADDIVETARFFSIPKELVKVHHPWERRRPAGQPVCGFQEQWKDHPCMRGSVGRMALAGCESTEPFISMISSAIVMRPYARIPLRTPFPLTPDVKVGLEEHEVPVFHALNKYIEELPYTEFSFECTQHTWEGNFWNAYTPDQTIKSVNSNMRRQQEVPLNLSIQSIQELKLYHRLMESAAVMNHRVPIATISLYRSFNDDAYITYKYEDGMIIRYYFDFIFLALGCRALLDDYECSWFGSLIL